MIRRTRPCVCFSLTVALALCLLSPALAADGDQAVATARHLHQTHADAVVWVFGVARIQLSAGNQAPPAQETEFEAIGTIIDEQGLVVCSYSALDPGSMFRGRPTNLPGGGAGSIQVRTDFKEVKVRLADGTEVPASVVLKDLDLDLAFVRIDMAAEEAEGIELTGVSLDDPAEPKVVDEVISLGRASRAYDRQPTVSLNRVVGVIRKPRPFYMAAVGLPGSPVFAADGRIVGIGVARMFQGRPAGQAILPAVDVAEIAAQAAVQPMPEQPDEQADAQTDEVGAEATVDREPVMSDTASQPSGN